MVIVSESEWFIIRGMAGSAHSLNGFDSHFGPDLAERRTVMNKMAELVQEYYDLLDKVERWDIDSTSFTHDLPEYFVNVLEAHETGSQPSDREVLSFRKKLSAMNNSLLR
jgi:hypothetical protein